MVQLADRVKFSTSTTGQGTTIAVGSPESGYQSVPSSLDGETLRIVIEDGNAWEISTAVYGHSSSNLTSRTLTSSSTGSLLNLSGSAKVFISPIVDDLQLVQVYSSTSDLPSASSNHGRITHVHGDGAMYFAHGGNWVRLANHSDAYTLPTASSSTLGGVKIGTGLSIDGSGVVTASSSGIALTDLSVTQNAASGTGTLSYNNSSGVFSYTPPSLTSSSAAPYSSNIYTANGSSPFNTGNTILTAAYTQGKEGVYVNGVKLLSGTDYTTNTGGTTITFTSALSTNDKVELVEHGALAASAFTDLTDTPSSLGTAGQLVQVNSAGNALEFADASSGGVNNQGTLTKTFIQDEIASITLSNAVSPVPVLSVFKEVSQIGLSSKGSWDVNSTASNYTRHDGAYASTSLTPSSATTDGTFTTSNPVATVSYDIASGSYMNKSHDHSVEENNARGLAFKSDGTKMYLVGTGDKRVRQYSLSTAWDVSTASYDSKDFGVSGQTTTPDSLTFSASGDKMFVCGYGAATLFEYDLSTDWDVSTASYNNNSKSIAGISGQGQPRGIAWKPDGSSFVVLGTSAYWLETFSLSSNWDLSSTLTVGTYVNLGAGAMGGVYGGTGVEWNSDGTKVYVACYSKDKIFEYSIASGYEYTANPASGAFVKTSNEFSLAPTVGNVGGIAMGDSGTKFYTVDSSTDTVRQYSMGGDQVFNTADLGKTIEGNNGVALVTGTYGAYELKTPFTNTNQLTSGNWALYGTQAKTDGSGIDISVSHAGHKVSSMSLTYSKFDITNYGSNATALRISPDGTKLYHCDIGSHNIYQFTLSTPFDLSTATTSNYTAYSISNIYDIMWNSDGSRVYFLQQSGGWIEKIPSTNYSLAGSITSGGSNINDHSTQSSSNWRSGVMSNDGTKLYMLQGSSKTVYQYSLTTPYTLADGYTFDSKSITLKQDKTAINLNISNDGTQLFYQQYQDGPKIITRFFGTPWDVSTATSTGEVEYEPTGTGFAIPGNDSMYVTFDPTGTIMYLRSYSEEKVYQYSTGESLIPDGVYHISVTSSLGQIDSSTWTDINSMTGDDTVGSGSVYYAISNDDHTTWSVNKGTDGVRKIAKNNSGTWQYNNDAGSSLSFQLANASYSNKSASVASEHSQPSGVAFKSDGTKMYVVGNSADDVSQYSLSTAWDVSTASYDSVSFSVSSQQGYPTGITFKPDGTKMYISGNGNDEVNSYTLSTAWDLSTASYTSVYAMWVPTGGVLDDPQDIFFKPDGTKMYVLSKWPSNQVKVWEFGLSTAWDPTSASITTSTDFLSVGSQETNAEGLVFSSDGTKVYICGWANNTVYQYNLSTAWDLSSGSYANISFSLASQETFCRGLAVSSDGTKLYAVGYNTDTVYQYSIEGIQYGTSETWVNATTNNELSALQQALGAQTYNRMDKAQLDAIPDANHFPTGDTFDLMIGLYIATNGGLIMPKSDGVTINYDAAAKIQQAVNGTDYEADFPTSTKVRIKSLAAQNLKVRVI